MGIKYLAKFVDESVDECTFTDNIEAGSTLVVDGSGFVFYILSTLTRLEIETGSGYESLCKLIHAHLCLLKFQLNMNLIFYMDGSATQYKNSTLEKRRMQREERWLKLYNFCTNRSKCDIRDLPTPPLVMSQLQHYLKHFRIPVVKCDGEADSAIASKCKELNISGKPAYCYAQDRYVNILLNLLLTVYIILIATS